MNSYEQCDRNNRKKKGVYSHMGEYTLSQNNAYDPYRYLRVAIIKQAAKDTVNKSSAAYKFWTSDWYDILSTGLEGLENNGIAIRDRLVEIGGLKREE